MEYSKQTWDTTSYVNPTRMNHIEDGIESAQANCRQNNTTGNAPYRILMGGYNDTTEINETKKNSDLNYNPSTKVFKAGGKEITKFGVPSSPAIITSSGNVTVGDLSQFRYLFIGIYASSNLLCSQFIPTATIDFASGNFSVWLSMNYSLSDTSKLHYARLLFNSATSINMTTFSNISDLRVYGVN